MSPSSKYRSNNYKVMHNFDSREMYRFYQYNAYFHCIEKKPAARDHINSQNPFLERENRRVRFLP